MLILGWIINVKQQHKRRVFAQCCQPQRLVGCLQTGFQTMGCERREGQNPRASLKEAHATLLLFLLLVVAPFGTSLCMQKASQDCTLLYSLWEAEIKISRMWDSLKDTTDVQREWRVIRKRKSNHGQELGHRCIGQDKLKAAPAQSYFLFAETPTPKQLNAENIVQAENSGSIPWNTGSRVKDLLWLVPMCCLRIGSRCMSSESKAAPTPAFPSRQVREAQPCRRAADRKKCVRPCFISSAVSTVGREEFEEGKKSVVEITEMWAMVQKAQGKQVRKKYPYPSSQPHSPKNTLLAWTDIHGAVCSNTVSTGPGFSPFS